MTRRVLTPAALATAALSFGLADGARAQDRSIFSLLDTGGRVVRSVGVVEGALSASDPLSEGGRRVQAWSLGVGPGAAMQLDLRSDDFDAYLYVVGPGLGSGLSDDDGGNGLNARLCVSFDEPGEYRAVASALGGATGVFTLEVRERPGTSDGACPDGDDESIDVEDLAALPLDGRALRTGATAEGVLSGDDPTVYGSPAQAWGVEGRAGEAFSVDLVSEDFDAYLMLQGPGLDEWMLDDDGAGGCNARIELTFPASGTYRVVASSLSGDTGAYRLVASAAPGPVADMACTVSSTSTPTADAVVVGALPLDELHAGSIGAEAGSFEGRPVQGWTFEGRGGARYAIDLRSDDFDSFLTLYGPGFGVDVGETLTDDDGGDGLDSRICVELSRDGTYTLWAGALSSGASGGYTIEATESAAEGLCAGFDLSAEAIAGALATIPDDGRRIGLDQTLEGALGPGATRHPDDDRPLQAWALDVPVGQEVYVDVLSDAFDPVLYAVGPGIDGVAFSDDEGDGCYPRLAILGGPGTVLLPGAFYAGATGAYRLRVSADPAPLEDGGCFGAPTDDPASGTTGAASDPGVLDHLSSGADRRIDVGTEVEGSLDFAGESLRAGQPAQVWTVEVRAGDELVVELISDDFDPVLYLDTGDPLGPLMDDDGAGNLDSRIVYTAGGDRTLRVVVTALTSEGSGAFRLRALRRVR